MNLRRIPACRTLLLGVAATLPAISQIQASGIDVTGRFRVVNGTREVPIGLFGVHATPLTPETRAAWGVESVRVIHHAPAGVPAVPGESKAIPEGIRHVVECFYDRYQPALVLTRPDWKAYLAELGRAYGTAARARGADGVERVVEFWNEPFLNWATRPGVNYDAAHFDSSDTTEGTPVRIRGWTEPLEWLVWSDKLVAVAEGGKVDYLASSYLPKDASENGTFEFRGKPRRIHRVPWARDITQSSYFSSRQNALFYRWMTATFASALKEANPGIPIVVGWGFHIQSDNWRAWDTLFRPLIDESIHWIDGIGEHHYGGDTRMVAGAYETVAAYAATQHGKRLQFYNTEAGGTLDPQRPDTPASSAFEANDNAALMATMTYGLRDLIHLLATCPDKAAARAAHMAHKNGERWALTLLRELRGSLLESACSDPAVWTTASLSGNRLCLVAYNDARAARSLPIRLVAPQGLRLTRGTRTAIESGPEGLHESTRPLQVEGPIWSGAADLRAKSAVRWVFELDGKPGSIRSADTTQHFAPGILHRVEPGTTVRLEIPLRGHLSGPNQTAALRVVQTGMAPGAVVCTVNERAVPISNLASWTNDWPLAAGTLRDRNTVTFECPAGASSGFMVCAASLLVTVETRK